MNAPSSAAKAGYPAKAPPDIPTVYNKNTVFGGTDSSTGIQ